MNKLPQGQRLHTQCPTVSQHQECEHSLGGSPAQGYTRSHKVYRGTCSHRQPQPLIQACRCRWQNSVPHSCRPEAFSSSRLVHTPCPVVPSGGGAPMIVASRRGSLDPAGKVAPACGNDPLRWSPLTGSKSQVHLQWREEGITLSMKTGDPPRGRLPH